jgi:hypothetical protein
MLAQCGQKEISSSVEVSLAVNNSRRSARAVHGRDQSAPMPTASSPTRADGPANLLALAKVADMAFDRIQGLQQNRSRSSRTAAARAEPQPLRAA